MESKALKVRDGLNVVLGAALLGLCAIMMVYARNLAWDSTRLAQSGGDILGWANAFALAALPLAWWLHKQLKDAFSVLVVSAGCAALMALMAPEGRFACMVVLAYAGAVALGPLMTRFDEAITPKRWSPWLLFALFVGVALTFVLHRHLRFGSGAWDLGCFSHSTWLASRM